MTSPQMEFPDEILLSIFATLERTDLKASRLVSKIWCECASTFLFDQIYVSSAKEDLEIFEAVAQNPLLSKCVRHLKYDATEFSELLTKPQYLVELRFQSQLLYGLDDRILWDTDDHDVNDWVSGAIFGGMSRGEATTRFLDSQLIKRGYRSYKEQALFQQAALKSGDFLQRLARGLHKIERLKEVTLESNWTYDRGANRLSRSGKNCTGSYLARHWNRFYCRPRGWAWGSRRALWDEDLQNGPDGTQSYQTLTTALVQAQCHIVSFTIGKDEGCWCPGLPPTLFDLSEPTAPQERKTLSNGVTAFANLESFRLLSLESYEGNRDREEKTPNMFDNIDGLPLILDSMSNLKCLVLFLSRDDSYSSLFYSEVQVLPGNKIWHNLESLTLDCLSITAEGLLRILLYRTPNISGLQIGNISLAEGSWEAFFVALSRSQQLRVFKFGLEYYLYHHDGEEFWTDGYSPSMFEVIENYVVHGGRHPSLCDDQPDSAANEWLREFDSTLRERIVQSGRLRAESAT